jgi:hypothetical protein
MNIAIWDEPKKFRTVWAGVPLTSQRLAMVTEIMRIAGISGTKTEMPREGMLPSSTGFSAWRNCGTGRSRLPRKRGQDQPGAEITEGMATRMPSTRMP